MKTVLVDVDTQFDFLFASGALYVAGAEAVLPNIARLNQIAAVRGWKLISTLDTHTENDPEFRKWPAHCVAGTMGQRKPASTLAGQIIVEKNVNDMFASPSLPALLDQLGAERYIVYGVVTEICVRCAAEGLLRRGGAEVHLVKDAVKALQDAEAEQFLEAFTGAGGKLTTVGEITS